MSDRIILDNVSLNGFLSFAEATPPISLSSLNVIVGSNASGKSNFLHGFRMLRGIAGDINQVFRELGGSGNAFFRREGTSEKMFFQCNGHKEEAIVDLTSFQYHLTINASPTDKWNLGEENFSSVASHTLTLNSYQQPTPADIGLSGLAAFPQGQNDELDSLRKALSQIWQNSFEFKNCVGNVRTEQQSDYPRSFPQENFKNLGVVLSEAEKDRTFRDSLYQYLKRVIPKFERLYIEPLGSQLMIHFFEEGITDPIPATRLSDGTLHFLCLLSVLLHPEPPPIICLEEPEIGLHPGAVHVVAELLHEASQRTQLIVTTHSDFLVDAIGKLDPGALMICEMGENGTEITRPDPEVLSKWMEKYSLGEVWMSGKIGGTP